MTTTIAPAEPGTLHHVPPKDLLCERNIRDIKVDGDLADSIKDLGVLTPITAVVNADGKFVVRHGHRRTFAAIAAGLDTVPVYVAGTDDLADAAEIDRIIRQRDENTARAGLTAAEDVGVVEQLVAFGLPVSEIGKKARLSDEHVAAALRVTASTKAKETAQKHADLTLDQVAAIADVEDKEDDVLELLEAAESGPGEFAHELQRIRDRRAAEAARAAVVAELEAAGVTVVESLSWQDTKGLRLDSLATKAGGTGIRPSTHKTCPGHIAWVVRRGWDGDVPKYEAEYGCADWRKHGHVSRWGSTSTKPKAENMSAKEREAAAAERRLVIDNNKAWASATKVRREWLANFAKTKTAPKGAAAFIAWTIAMDSSTLSDYRVAGFAAELLDSKSKDLSNWRSVATAAEKATEARALVIALFACLAAHEALITNHAWRGNGTTSKEGRYLRFLESAGYTLSDVEKFAISKKTV